MCDRFTNTMTWAEIHALYSIYDDAHPPSNMPPRYNIAPTQSVHVAHKDIAGELEIDYGRWWLGLSPSSQRTCRRRPCSMPGSRPSTHQALSGSPPSRSSALHRPTAISSGRPARKTARKTAAVAAPGLQALLLCRAMGTQQQARHYQLHDHYRAGGRPHRSHSHADARHA